MRFVTGFPAFALALFVSSSTSLGVATVACAADKSGAKSKAPQAASPKGRADAALIKAEWERFVKEPHPMGSEAQKTYAHHLRERLSKSGLEAEFHTFEAKAPNRDATKAERVVTEKGYNVVGTIGGKERCVVFLGGHYDTKEFKDARFVGANDGGSSTVLLLELARLARKETFPTGSWGACDLAFLFFDGEEAYLKDWNDGERVAGVRDHLYGSREFAGTRLGKGKDGKPTFGDKRVELLALFDMIGHKEQVVFVTQGSHAAATAQILGVRGDTPISSVPLGIEDDHLPFAERGVPFVHLIDWTNLKEWHTPADTLEICSPANVARLTDVALRFLFQPRKAP